MIEVNINNISKSFGADLIFENISFDVKTNERIGLIGPNGCGKTTILKIIYGMEHVQQGNVTFRKGSKLGYLHQIPDFGDEIIVSDILTSAFDEIYKQKRELDLSAKNLGVFQGERLEKELKRYADLTHAFELMGGYDLETKLKKVTTGLKITDYMLDMNFNVLSGGEKTRIMLGKILLEEPSILMLDEPSNHLDLESIEWLEGYLMNYQGAVIIVSHDRYFLDNVCNKLVELSSYKAHIYHGNYSYYVIEKERRFLLELKVYLAQERKINRMEEQIKRYRIWGVMRDSDKMFKRAKELERRLSKIEKLDKPKHKNKKMKLKNYDVSRSGKRVLEAFNISKSFDELDIFDDAQCEMIYQDRLGILGKNGSGKTTLLRILLEDKELEEPKFKWGSKLKIGYIAQEVFFPNEEDTILEHFMKSHNLNQGAARNELSKALFIRDDVHKKIKVLSGGEKSKLVLCSLTYDQTNFLILDEPTNHLDIDSREVLEEMLLEFKGTIMFVSHDRYFIQKIANRIAELRDLKLYYYEGDYAYYKSQKAKEPKIIEEKVKPEKEQTIKQEKPKIDQQKLYKDIEELENQIKIIDQKMKDHGFNHEKLETLFKEKQNLEIGIDTLIQKLEE